MSNRPLTNPNSTDISVEERALRLIFDLLQQGYSPNISVLSRLLRLEGRDATITVARLRRRGLIGPAGLGLTFPGLALAVRLPASSFVVMTARAA